MSCSINTGVRLHRKAEDAALRKRQARRHDNHRCILDTVSRRDPGKAEKLMQDHVASIKASLMG